MKELLEECTAGQPHPAARIHAKISIQEQLIKYLHGDRVGQSASMGTYCLGSPQVTTRPMEKREPEPFC